MNLDLVGGHQIRHHHEILCLIVTSNVNNKLKVGDSWSKRANGEAKAHQTTPYHTSPLATTHISSHADANTSVQGFGGGGVCGGGGACGGRGGGGGSDSGGGASSKPHTRHATFTTAKTATTANTTGTTGSATTSATTALLRLLRLRLYKCFKLEMLWCGVVSEVWCT